MAKNQAAANRMIKALRKFGLGYPGAHIKSPWPNHKDIAVNGRGAAGCGSAQCEEHRPWRVKTRFTPDFSGGARQ